MVVDDIDIDKNRTDHHLHHVIVTTPIVDLDWVVIVVDYYWTGWYYYNCYYYHHYFFYYYYSGGRMMMMMPIRIVEHLRRHSVL
jgi:hypothetical protein